MDRNRRPGSPVNVEMLREIMQLNFAMIETVLFLNTHPTCRPVLDLHNEFASRFNKLVERYQERYGPIYASYENAEYPWMWIEEPWPWEIKY